MGQYGSIWVILNKKKNRIFVMFVIMKPMIERIIEDIVPVTHTIKKRLQNDYKTTTKRLHKKIDAMKKIIEYINVNFVTKNINFHQDYQNTKKKCKSLELQQNINSKLSIITKDNENINKKLEELSNKPYTINNNTVNIETFLNTECSGAMNFLDFIKSLTITTDDIKRMGKTGFIKSYGELVTQKIKDMDIKDRPAHCTNKRQMFFFLKHNDIWTDDKEFELFNKSINLLKDKECEAWYNYSLEEREKNYVSDADVNSRADAISELAKMNDETLFTKIIKQASKELFLSKKDI
jgi:transcription initiation factor TFIIIB Brf1 subunit/transcription initiation factor TFIIB